MKGLKLLFKDKLTIIIAALLLVTLLACIPFVPSGAKYTKTSEFEFDFKVSSSKPVLRLGATNYEKGDRMSFKRALGELMVQELGYTSVKEALAAVKHIDIVYESDVDKSDRLLASGSDTVAESGVVAVRWDANEQKITISSEAEIYASYSCQDLFRGSDNVTAGINEPYGFINLESVNLPNLNTSNTIMMNQMFAGCEKLTGFDFTQLETDQVNNMAGFFTDCKSITSAGTSNCDVNFGNINTPKLVTWDSFFGNCTNLTSVDLSEFDTAKVDNLANFFNGCSSLTKITYGNNFDTGVVKDFQGMFQGCTSLEEINLTQFSTGDTLSIQYQNMFNGCTAVKSIDISTFDGKAYTMASMFLGCSSLTSVQFTTTGTLVTPATITDMFRGCSSLATLDLSHLDFAKVTAYSNMFLNCTMTVTKPATNWISPYNPNTANGTITFAN